jgi:ionotropic glutamate receptor
MSLINHRICIYSLLVHILHPSPSKALPNMIKIGGLFTKEQTEQEMLFRFAVDRINADITILPRTTLMAEVERIEELDSFHADKKVCSLLRNGVVAIFGPLSLGPTSTHISAICDALEIPHVETRWDFQLHRDDLSINLYPKTAVLAEAYVDLVKAWDWKTFAIAYENNEGIIRVQDFFKEAQRNEWQIQLYQFTPGKPYRETFWEINRSKVVNIVLDVKRENMINVLRHAQQVGMMTESHSYLITSLDLHTIDLEDFKFGQTKITSFRLVDVVSPELLSLMSDWTQLASKLGKKDVTQPKHILTESALIYDGIKLLATAMQDLDQSQSVDGIQPISCENGNPWLYGSSLINYMRPVNTL